jgi:uncharacterized protein involved in propanediol utilization
MFLKSEVYAKPGELMQGSLPGDQAFLLSNKSSSIFKTTTTIEATKLLGDSQLKVKSKAALELFWETLSSRQKRIDISTISIRQQSNIPIGKGLSSSSADVLGLLNLLNLYYETHYSDEKVYKIAAKIEPTDPCLHLGSVFFNQQKGEVLKVLPELPFRLIYFDSDIEFTIDTLEFSKTIAYPKNLLMDFQKLNESITLAFNNKDYHSFYTCVNASSEINNVFLPKRKFHILQKFAHIQKVGLFVAHSGTFMGLVMAPEMYNQVEPKAKELIKKHWNTAIYTE